MNRKSGNPLPSVPRWIKKKERKEQVGGQQPSGQWDKKKKKSFSAKVIKQGPNGQTGYKRQISLDVNSFCLETPAAFAQSKETQSYSAGLRVHQRSKRKEGKHAVVVLFHTVSFFINIRLPSLSVYIHTTQQQHQSLQRQYKARRQYRHIGWLAILQCTMQQQQRAVLYATNIIIFGEPRDNLNSCCDPAE